MERRINYPVGIQTFPEIIRDKYLYVDKSARIHQLVTSCKYVFLSRPRRFGKSLLTSTIESLFLGKRELFKDLAIDNMDFDWSRRAVFRLDLSGMNYTDKPEALYNRLNLYLSNWEKIYGAEEAEKELEDRLAGVITRARAKTGHRVVILIDEYDKPILDTAHVTENMEKCRNTLYGFYGALKHCDENIRFALITGVTKVAHVSIFSGLNNLEDISLLDEYSDICGISEAEFREYFSESVSQYATRRRTTESAVWDLFKKEYDGYRFSTGGVPIYNPFSVIKAFKYGKIGHYWFKSGTPTFLARLMKEREFNLSTLDDVKATESQLTDLPDLSSDIIPLLYQTGYLTIKREDTDYGIITLGLPNEEVRDAFWEALFKSYVQKDIPQGEIDMNTLRLSIQAGDVDGFMSQVQTIFAKLPTDGNKNLERHFHNIMTVIFMMLGYAPGIKVVSVKGSSDMVVMTKDNVYIFEYKIDSSPEAALRQIEEKGYARPYTGGPRHVILIGVNFDTADRSLASWKEKRYS